MRLDTPESFFDIWAGTIGYVVLAAYAKHAEYLLRYFRAA
jgi:hypothetical protein